MLLATDTKIADADADADADAAATAPILIIKKKARRSEKTRTNLDATNAAFERIKNHRKLFRRDWVPFIEGVYRLSLKAWESVDSPKQLDGSPDWTSPHVQTAFRDFTRGLPWEDYFSTRRSLLQSIRQIGGAMEPFLKWYDALPDERKEKVGYPVTLWQEYEKTLKPADDTAPAAADDATTAPADDTAPAERADTAPTERADDTTAPAAAEAKATTKTAADEELQLQSIPVEPLANALRLLITHYDNLPRMNGNNKVSDATIRNKTLPQLGEGFEWDAVGTVGSFLMRVGLVMKNGHSSGKEK